MNLPPAIIFVNSDISDYTKTMLSDQLIIDEVMTGQEFDNRVLSDPNYPTTIHLGNRRILVVRDSFRDYTNRNLADVVMFIKSGLASIEKNNYGPHGLTIPISNIEIHKILRYNNSQYVVINPIPPTYPFPYVPKPVGILADEMTDLSGVNCPNSDNEYNNQNFIHRK
jgi:hypothetical protein